MSSTVKLYETQTVRDVAGPTIRPGGLALTERALCFCGLPRGSVVMDIGCGSGATVAHLRRQHGLRAVGLDLSWMLLAEGRGRGNPPALVRGHAEILPIGDERLAAVFCECVLSLLTAPASALAEIKRVLAPSGFFIVSDLYDRNGGRERMLSTNDASSCLHGIVDFETLIQRTTAAGFDVLLFEDHSDLLKRLAAQLVWAYGSLAALRSAAGFGCDGSREESHGRPGYYLMVARKKGAHRHG